MELGGAAQGLAGADVASALLGVVDDDHGDGVAALQLSQIGEQRRHLTAGVLIDAMQTHEGIEHQQARLQVGDGVVEASAVGREIQSHGGCGDDLDVEIGKAEAGGGADAVEPPAHDVERVLGGIEQNAAGAWHAEATQARNAGRDRRGVLGGSDLEGVDDRALLQIAAHAPGVILQDAMHDEVVDDGNALPAPDEPRDAFQVEPAEARVAHVGV